METRRMSLRSVDSHGDENASIVDPPRRSGRVRTPSKKNDLIQAVLKPKAKGTSAKNTPTKRKQMSESEDDDQSDMSSSEKEEHVDENMPNPNNLFDDNTDVAGRLLYGFATPKKRGGMQNLAVKTPKTPATLLKKMSLISPSTPSTPKTPKSRTMALRENHQNFSTPSETRNKNKQELHKRARKKVEETESESSVDEDSDYENKESSESSDGESGDATSDDDDDDNDVVEPRKDTRKVPPIRISTKTAKITTVQPATRMSTRGRAKVNAHEDFVPDSDNYFISASNKKTKTSDHTLDQLKSSRLQHDELFSLLNSINSSEEHQQKIAEMIQDLQINFDRWMLEMSKGYNIIVYGCGSKQKLLHKFCETQLVDKPLLVVNGFFPSLTIKDILQAIKVQILEINTNSRNDHEVVDLISSALSSMPNGHVFLVINNIDGVMLRKTKDQHIISRLAKIKNLHLIASIDHINAPLMWDQTCMDNFNFVWYDCTTMLPYKNETAFENSVFFQNSGELDLAAMNNVFQSLTNNARGIYMVLVKSQMTNKKDSNYQGMTFKDLYHKCRESFLVSSDSTLRTQLIEFVDHNMVKIKRSQDGTELVSIPISTQILLLFAQQQNE